MAMTNQIKKIDDKWQSAILDQNKIRIQGRAFFKGTIETPSKHTIKQNNQKEIIIKMAKKKADEKQKWIITLQGC